tara:strand:+ start:311 stop:1102 length:792 start_codon:yes stop_codon:yes gene_type:complete
MVYLTKTSKGGVPSPLNNSKKTTGNSNNMSLLNRSLTYHEYYDPARGITLNKNKTYKLQLKHIGANYPYEVTPLKFLGKPVKLIRYLPESGMFEQQNDNTCHFSSNGKILEINGLDILSATDLTLMSNNSIVGGKKISKRKNMKGGEESWGATGMPSQFYNPKKPLVGYTANSGFNVPTAYGPSLPLDVGTGLLAPFTASKSPTANLATMNKTGGAKKKMKKTKSTKKSKESDKKDKKDKKGSKLPMKKKAKKTTSNKKGRSI